MREALRTSFPKRRMTVSFQAYLDNIKAKTGKTPEDFRRLARQEGLLRAGVKASELTAWLRKEFGLGLGHARAIYETLRPHLSGPDEPNPRSGAPRRGA
jgi:hypothetical protein